MMIKRCPKDEDEVVGENELEYCSGSKEGVKIFNQDSVICFKKPSVYAFRQCRHQSLCENCWTNSNVEMLNCAVCKT